MDITIEVNDEELRGKLNEDLETVKKIKEHLPLEAKGQTWGNELYFEIPVEIGEENSHSYVKRGNLAYWPRGNAFCIFYGKTPRSPSEEKIKPASPVNVIGSIENSEKLKGSESGIGVKVKEVD